MENDEEEFIKLNPEELTDHKLASPYEAFSSMNMFFPQQFSNIWLSQFEKYDDLKNWAIKADRNILSYSEYRANVFYNDESAIPKGSRQKSLSDFYKFAFNEYDLLSDEERKEDHGLVILTQNEYLEGLYPNTEITKSLKDYGEIFSTLNSQVMFVFPGDHFHPNEVYLWENKKSRHRMYISKGKVIRYEITKDVLARYRYEDESFGRLSQMFASL